MAINKSSSLLLAIFLAGCNGGVDSVDDSNDALDERAIEIVENLQAAGYPEAEIDIRDGGIVFVGGDAEVTLEASREMAGKRVVPSEFYTDDEFRQYSTNNLISSTISTICIDGSRYNGTHSTALDGAIANYNAQNLSFSMVRTNGSNNGCDAEITAYIDNSGGGVAGFPSGGNPYNEFYIGQSVANYGTAVTRHVITHELGHCIGFRHSDYYNRSISCGQGGNEGSAGVGANHIPGTPQTATSGGSVMNSCYSVNSDGVWTSSDETALQELYADEGDGGGGGGGGEEAGPNSCVDACGGNAGQCWCDSWCSYYGDCCDNKESTCG